MSDFTPTPTPSYSGKLRNHMLMVPECINECSGIRIFGRTIKSFVFSTDVATIASVNADAVIAVYPFTPQPRIVRAVISVADMPVFCGVGGGFTSGARSVAQAMEAEHCGAYGVVLNAPVSADILRDILAKTVITRTFEEVTGKDIKRIHQEPILFSQEEKDVWVQAVKEFHTMRRNYFATTNNARKDAMLWIIQQITLLLRISAAPNTVSEYTGELPGKLQKAIQLTGSWPNEIVAIGVRHKVVLDAYAAALREAFPDRPLFIVTGATTTLAKRRALRKTLRESGNGILLCTQQSLPSSVNFEFVNKVIIPELHYNNSRMSQFYMRFIRFNSVDWKDIYFLTYAQSIESNLMQMVLAKEKLNLFMKGDETDMDDIYEQFGVDYDLKSLLLYRDVDDEGHFSIRWGEQEIA